MGSGTSPSSHVSILIKTLATHTQSLFPESLQEPSYQPLLPWQVGHRLGKVSPSQRPQKMVSWEELA